MKREKLFYTVSAEVSLTEDEVDFLILCSREHYDLTCKLLSVESPGPGNGTMGLLLQMKKRFGYGPEGEPRPETINWDLSSRELNLFCKVVEKLFLPPHAEAARLGKQMMLIFDELQQEYHRLNPPFSP